MIFPVLALGLFLDFIIGDPRTPLHPVVLIGRLGRILERITRRKISGLILAGLITELVLLGIVGIVTWAVISSLAYVHPLAASVGSATVIAFSIGSQSLFQHTNAVADRLNAHDLVGAREKTSMIVGRDTADLPPEELVRATVESTAESLVDGITAPLFYAAIGFFFFGTAGAALGAILYRVVNTTDSLFGYKNAEYIEFGRVAARTDDLLNLIPSRITPFFVALAALVLRERSIATLRIWWRDGSNNPSPNSGQCEAAFAGALGVQLGGLNYYRGVASQKPLIGDRLEALNVKHIARANRLMLLTVGLWVSCLSIVLQFCLA
ncbi:MAG: cobalamin biosynthesis protein CobD [Leptospirales bacterium]|nr:cobalamin biosynthesis protein CobD [Leptospirales bacterium]